MATDESNPELLAELLGEGSSAKARFQAERAARRAAAAGAAEAAPTPAAPSAPTPSAKPKASKPTKITKTSIARTIKEQEAQRWDDFIAKAHATRAKRDEVAAKRQHSDSILAGTFKGTRDKRGRNYDPRAEHFGLTEKESSGLDRQLGRSDAPPEPPDTEHVWDWDKSTAYSRAEAERDALLRPRAYNPRSNNGAHNAHTGNVHSTNFVEGCAGCAEAQTRQEEYWAGERKSPAEREGLQAHKRMFQAQSIVKASRVAAFRAAHPPSPAPVARTTHRTIAGDPVHSGDTTHSDYIEGCPGCASKAKHRAEHLRVKNKKDKEIRNNESRT